MSNDITLDHIRHMLARPHTDQLTSFDEQNAFIDYFTNHSNHFLGPKYQALQDAYLGLRHAVKNDWIDAANLVLNFCSARSSFPWAETVAACTSTKMADIFLARLDPQDKWLDGTILSYIQPEILEHCLQDLLLKAPDYQLEHAMMTAIKAGRLDNLRVLDPHLNEDTRVKAVYWGAYYGHTDIVDAFYTPERGRWIDNTRATHGQHKKKASSEGMAHLEQKIAASTNHAALTQAVTAASQPAKARKI